MLSGPHYCFALPDLWACMTVENGAFRNCLGPAVNGIRVMNMHFGSALLTCSMAGSSTPASGATRRLRDAAPEFAEATCLAIACPACMTLELAKSCKGYVTTIVNNTDIVPTISPGQRHTTSRYRWLGALGLCSICLSSCASKIMGRWCPKYWRQVLLRHDTSFVSELGLSF